MPRSDWRVIGAAGLLAAAALGAAPRSGNAAALLQDEIVVADFASDALLRIDLSDPPQTAIVSKFGNFLTPHGVAVDSNGFAYVTDSENASVTRVEPADAGAQATVAFGTPFVGLRDGRGS